MKNKTCLLALISCFTLFSFSNMNDKPSGNSDIKDSSQEIFEVTSRQMDANNISTWYRTNGSYNRNPATGNAGFEWTKGSGIYARYASGIWLGCRSGSDTLTAIAEYAYDYEPGYVDNSGLPQGNDDPLYRTYLINRGNTTDPDYTAWPVNQGAYVNNNGTPFFLGTQTMFYSFTDAYPHESGTTSIQSLKAQILQTNWCYTNLGLRDVNFIEYRVINRSNTPWVDTYLAFWTDDDLGDALDDAVGCDTLRNLGFTYNANNNDPQYGAAPPAVGTKLLRSPIISTGNNNDTVRYYSPPGSQNLITKVGYKYSSLNIFNTYNNSAPQPSDPLNNRETYRVISGYWRLGDSWINPVTNQPTKSAYSGDPVTGTGWNMTGGGDRRYVQSFGPFNMNPNDTQSIIIAQVIARGNSNLNSITQLRNLSDYVQNIYNENFQSVLAVSNISTGIPDQFELKQNYPNPFNPVTNLEFGIPKSGFVSLKIYDALGKEIKTLVNEVKNPGIYRAEFDGNGLSSGIYFYKLETDGFAETKSMILLK